MRVKLATLSFALLASVACGSTKSSGSDAVDASVLGETALDGAGSPESSETSEASGSSGGSGASSGQGSGTSSGGSSGTGSGSGSTSSSGSSAGSSGGSSSGDAGSAGKVNVLTNRYDGARTGANPNETILNTTNVNAKDFGFLFSMSVTGKVYGQPLYVSGLTVNGAVHNVLYVATEHSVVYAFDADDGAMLWSKTLEPPIVLGQGTAFNPGCADMSGGAATFEVGITSTPVIDPTAGLIYVVNKASGKHMLHALRLTTGEDGPTPAQVGPATGFDSNVHLNRPGLLLLNGIVYIAFGSHCDAGTYHGWIFGHDAATLALKITYNTTPSGSEGAIWQGGAGLSTDGTNLWFSVGNGSQGGNNVGMSVVKASVSGATLANAASHGESGNGDNDLCGGAVLVGNHVLSGGKSGYVIVLNSADASQTQLLGAGGEVLNLATWDGGAAGQFVYTWGSGGELTSWHLTGGMLTNQTTNPEESPGHPGGMISVSSNGSTPGSAVVWAQIPTSGDAWHGTSPGAIYAYDASDVGKHSLWNSTLDTRAFGTYAKFSPPTVANGKVYAATFSGDIMVYGLK